MNQQQTSSSIGVLFDLDGTLLDTAPDLGGALNKVLEKHHLPAIDYSAYRVESSNGSLGLLKLGFADKLSDFDVKELQKEFLQIYENNLCRDTVPFEGVEQLINWLDKNNIPWGIVTNKPGWLTEQLLPNFPIFESCVTCFSGDTLPQKKPSPVPLLEAAKILKVSPQQIYYVGDAQRDMEAAIAANMKSVLARYGYLTEAELSTDWDVDYQIESVAELSTLLASI